MSVMASQIPSLTIVYLTVYSGADQRKHQSSASLAFVRGIHRWPVNFPHKVPATRKMFPFDDVIMEAWWRLGACYPFWVPRNHMEQWTSIVSCTLGKHIFESKCKLFLQENTFENVDGISTILLMNQLVKYCHALCITVLYLTILCRETDTSSNYIQCWGHQGKPFHSRKPEGVI